MRVRDMRRRGGGWRLRWLTEVGRLRMGRMGLDSAGLSCRMDDGFSLFDRVSWAGVWVSKQMGKLNGFLVGLVGGGLGFLLGLDWCLH